MKEIAINSKSADASSIFAELEIEAVKIHNEDISICDNIGKYGAELIKEGYGVLTHCNAGALATSGIGTALAPMYVAQKSGVKFKVYSDETRPLLQGLRLTAWELHKANIDVTTICDNMAAYVMSKRLVNLCIVGCDRVAKNGDTANKIGTLGVAILAKHYNIPFYVAMPSSTFDRDTLAGSDIVIEQRDSDEIGASAGVKVLNPAFDVTPNELITGFITESGIFNDTSKF